MAQKQPAKDAVSAAMSAIENALNLGDDRAASPAPPADPNSAAATPAKAQEPTEPPAPRRPPPAEEVKPPLVADPPANDDRPAIGPIVQALQMRRLSNAPVAAAAFGSLLWLTLCLLYAGGHVPSGAGRASFWRARKRSCSRWRRSDR